MTRILLLILLTGCVTPDEWHPNQHRKQMVHCKSMCEEGGVRSYAPFTGECKCRNSH